MIADKYKPTTQKSLFHKDIINHIRKWIKMIDDYADDKKSVKNILFLYGPVGCSKTVTVECLFKAYNVIEIDSDMLRSSDKISDILQSIVGFNEITLANIDKWNHKNKRDKSNVVFIDNLELCDRGIENFIDTLHNKNNINVPIILVCNNSKFRDIFANYNNCTFIEFKKPSLLELTKLSNEISKAESLSLTKDQIKKIIEHSEYDIRQLLFLLEQWLLSKQIYVPFEDFINSIQVKHTDKDLSEKMEYLFNYNKKFDIIETFTLASSEPQTLSCSIYQNYLSLDKPVLDKQKNIDLLSNYSNIMDCISVSNIIHNDIYEHQNWDLYNDYIFSSTVLPSYYLKKNTKILFDENFKTPETSDTHKTSDIHKTSDADKQKLYYQQFTPYKDISYNFLNSYEEVKKVSKVNLYSKVLKSDGLIVSPYTILEPTNCFIIVKMLINCIENLNEYFTKNKRGKNTTKKEKLDLCENITSDSVKRSLDTLVDNVYHYKLFEINTDDFLINKSKYKTNDDIKKDVQKVDLRVLKRFLNIFTMDDKHKTFKSHIETSIQYKILQRLVEDCEQQDKLSHDINNILTEDLDKIWNLT
jgi:DNA polymerase III delta prime subunit